MNRVVIQQETIKSIPNHPFFVTKTKVYLDNCSFTRPYDNQDQTRIHMETLAKMDVQKMITSGDVLLAASDYLINENSMKKDEDIRSHIYDFIVKNVVIFVSDKDSRLDPFIKEVMDSGVKDVDSAHVAAAIVAGCDYFITTDDRILKYRTDKIKIVTPIQFLTENEVR